MKTITFGGNVIATLFKMFCGLILAAVALLDVSCATIIRGTTDTLVVESIPIGSDVTLSNGMVGKTPASFVVPRTKALTVRIEHSGYEPTEVYVAPDAFSESGSGWIGGNVLAGGIVGIAIDGFSGAMYDLQPNPVRVRLVTRNSDNLPVPTDGLVKGSGTGFFITEDGYFLTNYHVVENAVFVEVVTGQGKKRAQVVRIDPVNDLAVLKIEGQFSSLPLISSKNVELGDPVFTVGFPRPLNQGISPKLTKGSINSLAGLKDNPRDFQTSVPGGPGSSGGPLLDDNGNVIGIVMGTFDEKITSKSTTGSLPQLVNYAVKSSYVLAFLETLPGVDGSLKEPFPKEQSEDRSASQKRALAATFMVLVQ